MFCPKCGAKAIEGADFCQKCGARLIKDEVKAPVSNKVSASSEFQKAGKLPHQSKGRSNVPVSPDVQGFHDRLTENTAACPQVKKIGFKKVGFGQTAPQILSIKSFWGVYDFAQNPQTRTSTLTRGWNWFSLSGLIIFLILLCDALFLAFFFQGDYYVALTICCLIGCIAWFPIVCLSTKENQAITAYVSKTLDCELRVPSKVLPIIICILNVIEIGLCVAALIFLFQSNTDTPYEGSDPSEIVDNSTGMSESPTEPSNTPAEGDTAFPYEARMAYAGKVQELAAENGDLQFALIDLTGKDIPELVAESSGYFVKVFFYDDGEVLGGDTWAYGAAGNMGYEYLPGENVIRNYNSDYAGDIQYESYAALGSAGELSPLPNDQLSIRYFRDSNGNGYPDDDEPFLEEPLYYVGDSEVSKDVYTSHQITGEFEWLGGDKSAEEMMALLGIDYEITYPNEESSMGGNIVTAPDIVTPPSDPGTSSAEYAKLVEFGDEESWITLYQDGTFDMQVSLSNTYGTLSGTYEETDWGFACYVKEKSFSGYGSDDVEYFELVICDYGVEYRGDAVGTWTDDGPVYQVVEP